jgi:hypothetical protein
VFIAQLRIDDVEGPVAPFESLLNKGKQYTILVVEAFKESADVTVFAERRAGEMYGLARWRTRRRIGFDRIHNGVLSLEIRKRNLLVEGYSRIWGCPDLVDGLGLSFSSSDSIPPFVSKGFLVDDPGDGSYLSGVIVIVSSTIAAG